MSALEKTLIWAAVIGVVFGILWWQGIIKRIKDYWDETWVELQKCTWPTWEELKGSTIVITLSIVALGGFTVAVDRLLFLVFFKL